MRTLTFVAIVFGNQATTYDNRERRRLWSSRPSSWLIASSAVDVALAGTLAISGLGMAALPVWLVVSVLAATVIFAVMMDVVKVPVFARLGIV